MFDFMLLLWVYPTALVICSPTRNHLFSHAVLMAIVFCVSVVILGPSVVHCYNAAVVALMRSNTCLLLWLWPPHTHTRSTQPCIPPGSLNRVPASAGVRAGMSPLPGGR